jgi:hypothetical protein
VRAKAPNWNATTAQIQLRAVVKDAPDSSPGDVRNASVTFYRDIPGDPSKRLGDHEIPVALLDVGDLAEGEVQASFDYAFNPEEAAERRAEIVVYAVVGGFYEGASIPQKIVAVAKADSKSIGSLALGDEIRVEAKFHQNSGDQPGALIMEISGRAGEEYIIEASSDLRLWQEAGRLRSVSGEVEYAFPLQLSESARFFRIRLLSASKSTK